MCKSKLTIIPLIVFVVTFTTFVFILERTAADGKYEREIKLNYSSDILEVKTIKDEIAALRIKNEVLLLEKGDTYVLEGPMEYAGSITIDKIKKNSVVISFDIQKTNRYYLRHLLSLLFSLVTALLVRESMKSNKIQK